VHRFSIAEPTLRTRMDFNFWRGVAWVADWFESTYNERKESCEAAVLCGENLLGSGAFCGVAVNCGGKENARHQMSYCR